MGLFDAFFGGDAVGEAQESVRRESARGTALVREATDRASAERARALGPIFREMETLRALRDFRDPLARTADLEGVRGQAAGTIRAAQRAAGLTGAPGAALAEAEGRFLSEALDARSSARIRRFESTTQLLAGLAGTAGQITTAGSNAELAAISGIADRTIAAAAAIGQSAIAAETERFGAVFGAIGAAVGGGIGAGFFGGE